MSTRTRTTRGPRAVRRPLLAALAAALALPAVALAPPATAATSSQLPASLRPRAVDLQVPGDFSQAQHISGSGVVVGTTWTGDDAQVFRWRAGVVELLPVTASSVDAVDVNLKGQAVVNVRDGGLTRVVLWQPDGTVVPVSLDGVWSQATDLNDNGVVSGIVATDDGQQRAVIWKGGQQVDLGDVGLGYVYASGLNNRDQVVGTVTQPDWSDRAFVWQKGVMTVLPLPAGAATSVGWSVNERGDVLGRIDGEGTPPGGRPVVWDRAATPRYVGPAGVRANDMNVNGLVAGAVEREPLGVLDAATVDRTGVTRLPTPHGAPGEARAVNDLGIVAGYENGTVRQALAWVLGYPVPLAPPAGRTVSGSAAIDVNGKGQVVGSISVPGPSGALTDRAVLWDLTSVIRRLG